MAYSFLRWYRTGLAAVLGDQPQSSGAGQRATLSLGVDITGTGLPTQVATAELSVLGPGDVTGIDDRQMVRSFPVPGTPDFEPTFHAHVDFDRPDLPWLFTPFGPDANGALHPWLCLVVVEKGEHGSLAAGLPRPILTVGGPEVASLPDLSDAHRWAHVQVTGAIGAGVDVIARDEPERIVSRLVCPRELTAATSYLACVVPTFAVGALAGLGRAVPTSPPRDSWLPTDTTVELPVYHHWEFTTGPAGDFRSLVLRLERREGLSGVGTRPLDVSRPGFGLADRPAAAPVDLGGVFRTAVPNPEPADPDLADLLAPVLNATDAVGPPIYGRWHAATTSVSEPAVAPLGWLDALNLDARHRVAAGLGTQVVQERQEDLMAAVWQQLGEILRANQLLRQAQLAIAASERVVARHLATLPDAVLLSVAGPAIARIRAGTRRSVRGAVARSCLPPLAVSGAFRKVVRVHGPIERRLRPRPGARFPDLPPAPSVDATSLIERLASGSLDPPDPRAPDGAVTMSLRASIKQSGRALTGTRGRDTLGDASALREVSKTFALLERRARPTACTELDIGATAATIRAAVDPDVAIAGRARNQVRVPASNRVVLSARLDPIMAAPEIPTPMIGPLHDLGQDWILPGIDGVPANTIAIVEPNDELIEAYMVGLNHEMGRELLWRGFPTDQRGTVFSRFWDRRGSVGTPVDQVPDRDIPDIHGWDTGDVLGSHVDAGGAHGPVVLLLRGDLLQRYPSPTVFVQRGRWKRDAGGAVEFDADDVGQREPVPVSSTAGWNDDTRFPQFNAMVGADIAYYGFALTAAMIRGVDGRDATAATTDDDAGWYVVFQEQLTEPRFGAGASPSQATTAEQLAKDLLRPPFRLFVHASDLVGG